MWNPISWYRQRGRGLKIAILAVGTILGLGLLYGSARAVQYAGASRSPAGVFVPEGAEAVVRVSDLAGKWKSVQQTEFWKTFKSRLQKDPAIRASLNDILAQAGAPTLEQLEDKRWLDRNPLLQESTMVRFAGRDLVVSSIGSKFCVATRLGLGDFILLPVLQMFPAVAGATRAEAGGAPVLKRGELYIAIQGAIVVVSNDASMLASALKRRGTPETPSGLLRATVQAQPIMPALRGFPVGSLLAVADVESARRIVVDVAIEKADLVVRASFDGMAARAPDPAPVDTVRMIPKNGIGACMTNVDFAPFWEWAKRIGDRRIRSGTPLDKIARDNLGEFVEILQSQRFGEEVVPKLDGPVSVLFGASKGEDGKTYAAVTLYLRCGAPREAADALQAILDRATEKARDRFKPTVGEAGGISHRSYRFDPDPFRFNNYMALCYAVTADALILSNNLGFLEDALKCRAIDEPPMAVQLHYEQAMRRLQELGLKRVMAPGATSSLFLYGPAIRQGLEGFYEAVASKMVDNPRSKALLRQELETSAAKEGHPMRLDELDKRVRIVLDERIKEREKSLRDQARILDYLNWVAFQAEPGKDGMKFEAALELK